MVEPGSKIIDFISKYLSGYVSYLDRTSDAALFAQPVREDVIAEMTKEQLKQLKEKVFHLTNKNTDVPIETFKPPSKDNLVLDANKDPTAVILDTLSSDDRAKYIGFVKAFLENKIDHLLFDKNKNDIFSKYHGTPLIQIMQMPTKPIFSTLKVTDGQGEDCSSLFQPYGLKTMSHFEKFIQKANSQRPQLSTDDITTLDEMKECLSKTALDLAPLVDSLSLIKKSSKYSGKSNYKDLLDKLNTKPKGVVSKMLSYVGMDDGVDKVISRIGRSRQDGGGSPRRKCVNGSYIKKRQQSPKKTNINSARSRRNRL